MRRKADKESDAKIFSGLRCKSVNRKHIRYLAKKMKMKEKLYHTLYLAVRILCAESVARACLEVLYRVLFEFAGRCWTLSPRSCCRAAECWTLKEAAGEREEAGGAVGGSRSPFSLLGTLPLILIETVGVMRTFSSYDCSRSKWYWYFLLLEHHVKFTELTSDGITGRLRLKFGLLRCSDTLPFVMAKIFAWKPLKRCTCSSSIHSDKSSSQWRAYFCIRLLCAAVDAIATLDEISRKTLSWIILNAGRERVNHLECIQRNRTARTTTTKKAEKLIFAAHNQRRTKGTTTAIVGSAQEANQCDQNTFEQVDNYLLSFLEIFLLYDFARCADAPSRFAIWIGI